MMKYAAGVIKRRFARCLLYGAIFGCSRQMLMLSSTEFWKHVFAIILLISSVLFLVGFAIIIFQFCYTTISTLTGFGWFKKKLNPVQVHKSVLCDDELIKKISYGCTFRYWKCPFMKRYLEDVVDD